MLGGTTTRVSRHHAPRKGSFQRASSVAPEIQQPDAYGDPSQPLPGSCGVCCSGLVSIKVAVPQEALGEYYQPGATRDYAYRCLCAYGQRKSFSVFGPDVGTVLGVDGLHELYPDGIPDVHVQGPTALDGMLKAGVPPACAAWTFTSYGAKFADADHRQMTTRGVQWVSTDAEERPDVILFGPNGTGKSGLALAMLRGALEGAERVAFYSLKLLSTRWRSTYGRPNEGTQPSAEEDLLNSLVTLDVLVVDEVGGTRLSEFVEDTLTLIVDTRQKSFKPTIITVNVTSEGEPSQEMARMLGPALFDRLRERAQFWPLLGKSGRRPSLPVGEAE